MNIIFKPECKTEIIEPTYDLPIIGEPISKTGASANNSNAYGVIVGIIGDGSSRRVRVMTEGYIDYDKVKENYMEYTDEAINALTGITLCSGGKLPTGVQPDWNQNDDTKPDYVKNRPFYAGDPVETVLVEESTITFSERNGIYQAVVPSTFKATVGETYKVSWDGTVYECTCAIVKNLPAFGNLSIMGAGSDTGEPFLMGVENGERIQIFTADTSASHTISISGYNKSVVKINTKYLPVASETEPGIVSITPLSKVILQNVKNEYFSGSQLQVSGYGDAGTIEEYAGKNNSYGIFSPGKFSGAVLSCDIDAVYITTVLSGGEYIECWKFSQGSTAMEQLWGIYKDGVVISSSTADSTKKFRITVDDSGTLTATEVTE